MKQLEIFTASWCLPCNQLKKVLSTLVLSTTELKLLSIDENEEAKYQAVKAGVRSVPTLILRDQDGNELKRTTGVKTADQLIEFIS